MSDERYDVFISHRRKEGWKDARLLYFALREKGYKVYLDVENPKPGQIDVILSKVIDNSDHFVIVLTPGALDGCWDEEDWVRLEVEKARKSHKNIIPVLTDGFSFPKDLPTSMRFLKKQGGLTVSQDFYGDFINKLAAFFEQQPETPVQTGEISDSWAEIIKAIDDGTVMRHYKVGDCIPLKLGRFGTINMQLAGFNLDERADGKGKAPTTWIAKELLPEARALCEDWEKWYNEGWAGSDLRQWLRDEVFSDLPHMLRDKLIPVKKYNKGFLDNHPTTADRLWIPSGPEVFGDDSLYYDLFQDEYANRVKTRNGSAAWWWLRSAYINGGAYYVTTSGSSNAYGVYFSGGVALGFCL